MKIKMNTLLAGPAGVMEAGKIYDVDPDKAHQLVAGGYAILLEQPAKKSPVPVEPAPVIEAAVPETSPVEAAVQPRPARRRKSS